MKIRYSMSHKPLGQPVHVGVCTRAHVHAPAHVLVMGDGKPIVMGEESGRLPGYRDSGAPVSP